MCGNILLLFRATPAYTPAGSLAAPAGLPPPPLEQSFVHRAKSWQHLEAVPQRRVLLPWRGEEQTFSSVPAARLAIAALSLWLLLGWVPSLTQSPLCRRWILDMVF